MRQVKNSKLKVTNDKNNMRIFYEKDNLSDPQIQNVWTILQRVKETLDYGKPNITISISLDPEDYCIKISSVQIRAILDDWQTRGILKFIRRSELDQNLKSVPAEIEIEKFNAEYKSVEDEITNRNLEATEKPEGKKSSQSELPNDLKWPEITIRFLNGHEAIIKARELSKHTDYEEMGFKDQKRNLPNKQWELLELLAEKEGELSWGNTNLSLENMSKFKKQKQILSDSLKTYFKIEEDPFYDYKKEKAYKIKINLMPETKDQNDRNGDNLGIKKHYKGQTPQTYEEGK